MTKQELRSYSKIAGEIRQLEGLIRELNSRAYSPRIPHLTGLPGAASTDPGSTQERIATEIMGVREKYEQRILDLLALRKRIENAIDGLEDPDQRMILRYHYIAGYGWTKTAQLVHYSRKTVERKHGSALLALKDGAL